MTLSLILFGTNCVVVITEYWSSNLFTTNELVNKIRNVKSNASQNAELEEEDDYQKMRRMPDLFMKQNAPQARLIK